jgi:hypothetical protein
MPLPAIDPRHLLGLAPSMGPSLRAALHWGSEHTGLPVILVAAIAVVTSFRLFRRTLRFAIEVVVCVAALAFAAGLGWIHW